MSVGIDMALEGRSGRLPENRQILGNIELNWQCRLTRVCGSSCFLNQTAVGLSQVEAPSSEIMEATYEFIRNGEHVRHLVFAGKEVMETPDRVFPALKCYHETAKSKRPGSIGMITAYPQGLAENRMLFEMLPLSWLIISVDTFSPLHRERDSEPLLRNALITRDSGGAKMLGVNTTFTNENVDRVINLGKGLERAAIDQWSVGQMKHVVNGKMVPSTTRQTVDQIIERVCRNFGDGEMQVIVDVDHGTYRDLIPNPGSATTKRWRFEYPLASRVLLTCGNPVPGRFLRVRYDLQLLDREDLARVGIQMGQYGRYENGRIAKVLRALECREQSAELVTAG